MKPLTIAILVCNAVAIVVFGRTPHDLNTLTWIAITVGFFGNAAISGMYSIAAYAFPTHVRATGTGFVIGMGRIGAFLSPPLTGFLFGGATTSIPVEKLPSVAVVMGMGSLLAAVALLFLKMNVEQPASESQPKPARAARTA